MIRRSIGAALTQGRPRAGLALLGGALCGVTVLVIEGSGPPAAGGPWQPPFAHFDKLLHAVAHFGLTTLLLWGLALLPACIARWPAPARRLRAIGLSAVGLDSLAGLGVEIAQKWLGRSHGRRFDIWDVLANQAGSGAALVLFIAIAAAALMAYTGAD